MVGAMTAADPGARARALYEEGLAHFRRGEQLRSRACNEEALALARAAGDREAEALALVGLSRVAFRDGEHDRVRALAGEALALADGLPDSARVAPLHMQAAGTRLLGDLDGAAGLYRESLALNRALGNERMVAVELHNLAHVELRRGDAAAARALFAELRALREGSEDPYDRAMDRLNAAALAAEGDPARAAALLGECEATLATAGIVLDPDDRFEFDDLRARLNGV